MSDPIPAPTPPPAPPAPEPVTITVPPWAVKGCRLARAAALLPFRIDAKYVAWLALAVALFGHGGCTLPGLPNFSGFSGFLSSLWPGPHKPAVQPLRVLVMEVTADRTKLPAGQLAVLTSESVTAALDANCLDGPNGRKEWRIFDANQDVSHESADWQKAVAAVKGKNPALPYVAVGGASGTLYEGPLPKSETDMIALLKKYGGK